MKKLKKLSDIPAWFEISKYDKVSSLTLYQWYDQISKRQSLDEVIFLYMESDIEAIGAWENLIKTNPIIENNDNLIRDMIKDFDNAVITNGPQETIRDFSAGDLSVINNAINLKCNDDWLRRFCENRASDATLMELDINTIINMTNTSIQLESDIYPWIYNCAVALTANLEASDEQLFNDFKAWLKHARKNFNSSATEKMITYIDFKDWCEYAILPYFDLATWAKLHGAEFTSSIMSQAIFPNAGIDGFCGESRVRRETKRRSSEIFNRNAICAMLAQVNKMAKN